MKLSIQITLDYEVFGDGTGDVYREQIIPTNHLMDICEQYSANLTVYFEYGQYLAYEKFYSLEPKFGIANSAITDQLKDLIRRGHDVQFHFHPAWLGATYSPGTGFLLNKSQYDITFLKFDDIVRTLSEGKKFLESMLQIINPKYRCIAFRAGAWSAQDSKKLIKALVKSGFKIDSTVAKGAHLKSGYGMFDYRRCTRKPFWFASENISHEDSGGENILELPILTKRTKLAPFYYLSRKRAYVNSIVKGFYKTKVTDQGAGKLDKVRKILGRDYFMADFNFMRSETICKMITSELSALESLDKCIPLTLIGHSKTSYLNDDLHLLFRKLKQGVDVSFDTVSEFYINYIEKNDETIIEAHTDADFK